MSAEPRGSAEPEQAVAEVLERIRARLQQQSLASLSVVPRAHPVVGREPCEEPVMRRLLEALLVAQSQIGVVNPRPPGMHNALIQGVKRLLRGLLSWYTRPLVQYHTLNNQFLSEAIQIFERQQEQLQTLAEKNEALAAAQAQLREQMQEALDALLREREKAERGRL